MTVVAMDTTARLQYSHRHRRGRPPATSTAGSLPRLSLMQPSLRRRDLDRAGGGAAETVGPVHVLHIGLRMDVAAGRHGAHHIGDGEDRWIAALALERGAEAVVTELGVPGSCASSIQASVPVLPDETSRGLSISKPAGR